MKTSTEMIGYTFSSHIRNRATGLIRVTPFNHIHTHVLTAIASIDADKDQDLSVLDDRSAKKLIANTNQYQRYLQSIGISHDQSATEYLDWVEPKIRGWMLKYEALAATQTHQIKQLVASFE